MLKLMNSVLILVILCGGLQLSHGEKLKCQFRNDLNYHVVGDLYSCFVTSLDNSFDNMTIVGYNGVHMGIKNDKDVKAIYINGANLKYIPHGLGSLSNLLGLAIWTSQLVEIRSNDFLGMQNLEYLSLYDNKLTSVPADAFSTLPKLKYIYLHSNQIKYIGSGAFDQLTNLNRVDLSGNICVNKYYNGASGITQMKEDLKVKCYNPDAVPETTTTTTTTTTQNPMEVELEALKNELAATTKELQKEQLENLKVKIERDAWIKEKESLMKERDDLVISHDVMERELRNKTSEIIELNDKFQTNCKQPIEALDVKLNVMMEHLLKESKEHQMECNEIIKLRAELSLKTDLLKATKDQQKKDLSEAKETMKQTINDLNKEVMELKNQRQLERNTYMGLRTKLMETKEQLATCEINERSLI